MTEKISVLFLDPTPSFYPGDNVKIDVYPVPTGSDRINISWTVSTKLTKNTLVVEIFFNSTHFQLLLILKTVKVQNSEE